MACAESPEQKMNTPMVRNACVVILMVLAAGCAGRAQKVREPNTQPASTTWFDGKDSLPKLLLSDAEWRKRLAPEAYEVLRGHGTERPFTCGFLQNKEPGAYSCGGCGLLLFTTESKFDSGTGWPSYGQPANPNHIYEVEDNSYGMLRREVRCARCDGHLGHVFDDGPPPTGLRYCINGVALKFEPYR